MEKIFFELAVVHRATNAADQGRMDSDGVLRVCIQALKTVDWSAIAKSALDRISARTLLNWVEPILACAMRHTRGTIRDVAALGIDGLVDALLVLSKWGNHPARGSVRIYTGGHLHHVPLLYTGSAEEQDFATRVRRTENSSKAICDELNRLISANDDAVLDDALLPDFLGNIEAHLAALLRELTNYVRQQDLQGTEWTSRLRGYMSTFDIGGTPTAGPDPSTLLSLERLTVALGVMSVTELAALNSRPHALLSDDRKLITNQFQIPSLPEILMKRLEALVARPAANQNPRVLAEAALYDSDSVQLPAVLLRCAQIVQAAVAVKRVYAEAVASFAQCDPIALGAAEGSVANSEVRQLAARNNASSTLVLLGHELRRANVG